MRCTYYLNAQLMNMSGRPIRQTFSRSLPQMSQWGRQHEQTQPYLVNKRFMDSGPAWTLARYVFECMEHRREYGRAVMSSEELENQWSTARIVCCMLMSIIGTCRQMLMNICID